MNSSSHLQVVKEERSFLATNASSEVSSTASVAVSLQQPLVAENGEHFEIAVNRVGYFPTFIPTIAPDWTYVEFTFQYGDKEPPGAVGYDPKSFTWSITFQLHIPEEVISLPHLVDYLNQEILALWKPYLPGWFGGTKKSKIETNYGSTYKIDFDYPEQWHDEMNWVEDGNGDVDFQGDATGPVLGYYATNLNYDNTLDSDVNDPTTYIGPENFLDLNTGISLTYSQVTDVGFANVRTATELALSDPPPTFRPPEFYYNEGTGGIEILLTPPGKSADASSDWIAGTVNDENQVIPYISEALFWVADDNPLGSDPAHRAALMPCTVCRYFSIPTTTRPTHLFPHLGQPHTQPTLELDPYYSTKDSEGKAFENSFGGTYLQDQSGMEPTFWYWRPEKFDDIWSSTKFFRLPDFYPHNLYVNVDTVQRDQEQVGFQYTVPNGTVIAVPLKPTVKHVWDVFFPHNLTWYRMDRKMIDTLNLDFHVDNRQYITRSEERLYPIEVEFIVRTIFNEEEAEQGVNQTITAAPILGFSGLSGRF